jgi:hypothetical protein
LRVAIRPDQQTMEALVRAIVIHVKKK